METRTKVYLIDSYETEILGAKLPSYRQVFGHFLHHHKVEKKSIREASRATIQVVTAVWLKAGLPIRAEQHAIKKLENIHIEWQALQKHKNRPTPGHKKKEAEFVDRLEDVFDIAHADALTLITIPEDRAFLISQRKKGRPGSIGSIDMVHAARSEKAQKRYEAELMRQNKSKDEMESSSSQVTHKNHKFINLIITISLSNIDY